MEISGVMGTRANGVRKLADALGWTDELESLWDEVLVAKSDESKFDNAPNLDECIEKMASKMKDGIKISDGHKRMLENHLGNKLANILDKALKTFSIFTVSTYYEN